MVSFFFYFPSSLGLDTCIQTVDENLETGVCWVYCLRFGARECLSVSLILGDIYVVTIDRRGKKARKGLFMIA